MSSEAEGAATAAPAVTSAGVQTTVSLRVGGTVDLVAAADQQASAHTQTSLTVPPQAQPTTQPSTTTNQSPLKTLVTVLTRPSTGTKWGLQISLFEGQYLMLGGADCSHVRKMTTLGQVTDANVGIPGVTSTSTYTHPIGGTGGTSGTSGTSPAASHTKILVIGDNAMRTQRLETKRLNINWRQT